MQTMRFLAAGVAFVEVTSFVLRPALTQSSALAPGCRPSCTTKARPRGKAEVAVLKRFWTRSPLSVVKFWSPEAQRPGRGPVLMCCRGEGTRVPKHGDASAVLASLQRGDILV